METDKFSEKMDKLDNIREEIRSSFQPKSLQMSLDSQELTELAVETWRVRHRLEKIKTNFNEDVWKSLSNSFEKINRFFEKHDLEIKDLTGEKYSPGISAIDIVSVEKDPKIKEDIIKETVEPAIFIKGQLVKKSLVILLSRG